jgi:hypothetical protein
VLVSSQQLGIDLIGPVRADTSWQAQTEGAFDITQFEIDWERQTVKCPLGKLIYYWREGLGKHGKPNINVGFRPSDCRACACTSRCTRNVGNGARTLTFPRKAILALQAARERQQTDEFRRYRARAGVEGVISGDRRPRHATNTLPRTVQDHLQNVATASAINLLRAFHWLMGKPKAETRVSSFAALAA